MTEAAQEDSDAPVLKEKMEDALRTLRDSKSGGAALYDLPWYLIIGPPGAGKTTALVNSGLQLSARRRRRPKAVAGIGGTRYCDWWFTDQALLIDTAGRYTTQDSDAKADKSWLSFLDLLRRNRPRQPINGVHGRDLIADLLTLSARGSLGPRRRDPQAPRRTARASAHQLPRLCVFTKMDLIVGFAQYFADLDEAGGKSVWGATFQTAEQDRNKTVQVGRFPTSSISWSSASSSACPSACRRSRTCARASPCSACRRSSAPIRKPIVEFLNRVFEPTRYQTTATLRGFYFTSGTQEGTPLDARHRRAAKELRRREFRRGGLLRRRQRAISCTT